MTASTQLTTDLQKLVLEVENDLRNRLVADEQLKQKWQDAHKDAVGARRTAMAWTTWRDDRIVQAAVSWVLTTVFVRFAEDNDLISRTWFIGPGERRHHAVEAQQDFFRKYPELTDREWIEDSFAHLRSIPATAGLVDEHAGLQMISPSGQMARRILDFWRQLDDDGTLLHDLADPALSTRFLGDLYQDLSAHARETFALLQTPDFVEEFILDQTLTPALAERPLEGFKLIDPTCGSGHFLLGAFARFNESWKQKAPELDTRQRVQLALDSVYGVDINAFAVAIARFRLTIAALQACGEESLESGQGFDIHVETGDSLIHGKAQDMFEGFSDGTGDDLFSYATEDQRALKEILRPGQYDAVVGNPPYITVKDPTLNVRYRELYTTCKGKYALTAPFMERFFDLARPQSSVRPAGWTGQITSNSFMKREFGTKVIEDFLAKLDLRAVVDTSGAYIPGHGTPTVILVGRNDRPQEGTVRTVLGIRGEPGRPANASQGLVWSSIATNFDDLGYEDEWVSVADLNREVLAHHPWSLTGGAAFDVAAQIEKAQDRLLGPETYRMGFFGVMGSDDAMVLAPGVTERTGREVAAVSELVAGDAVRDFGVTETHPTWFPYTRAHSLCDIALFPGWGRHLWKVRTELGNRATFSKRTYIAEGRPFYEWHQLPKDEGASSLALVFAFVATHNHFMLDRGGKVFNRSAPVIKLPEGATEEEHLRLLGVLNSSVACFWLKQNSYPKSGEHVLWAERFEFTSTTLKDFPLPRRMSDEPTTSLDDLAQQRQRITEHVTAPDVVPTAPFLADLEAQDASLRRRMVALQEEMDWQNYVAYGLLEEELTLDQANVPEVALGQRAFEIVMGRQIDSGELDTAWFDRHGSTPITEIPHDWPQDYRDLVQRRIDVIEADRMINLLERPEYKRRWSEEPWEKRQERALRTWLLDRIEARANWFDKQGRPAVRSVGQLADALGRDTDFTSVLDLWAGHRDADPVTTLTKLLSNEVVPYLAAWRLKEPGMRKWDAWTSTWDLQRREDTGEDVGTIPVPPKYTTADFRKQSYWSHRGKLDVPKERFILYPEAELSTDRSMLLGWAGWNHAQQFQALAAHMDKMINDGADDARLLPVLAGLYELTPWVEQWHSDIDPAYGISLGDFSSQELDQRRARLGVSFDDLTGWRPPKTTRRRKQNA